jgi:bifunctional non-homologous end joining protein LigD
MLNFIAPATPVLRSAPPRGADWLHEAKFDGWRIQLHKDGSVARLYTKGGYDCTTRFGGLRSSCTRTAALRDLLFHNGRDVRELPLVERKDLLMVLIMGAGDSRLRLSDGFDDGGELLAAAERMGLEGVVSKRRDAPYRSGSQCGWIKTKTRAWREANKDRWRLFERH